MGERDMSSSLDRHTGTGSTGVATRGVEEEEEEGVVAGLNRTGEGVWGRKSGDCMIVGFA